MQPNIFPFLWMRGEDEETIRREIAKINACGIYALCVEARPHEDFCGPLWWRDMDIVLDEAKKRGMKIWILDDKHFPTGYAAGLIETRYPERKKWYLAASSADFFGSERPGTLEVSRMLKPAIGFWQLGQPADEEERRRNQLVALIAAKFQTEDFFEEQVVDLTDAVKEGRATFCLPEGQWRIFAIYKTRTDGGNENYINMIDETSAHTQLEGVYQAHYERYPEEFGTTIAGFFSDEPELGNTKEICFDAKVGKQGLPLPWSEELETLLRASRPERFREDLVFLFAKAAAGRRCPQMRYDYMDLVTRLYEKHFSSAIGNWCRDHGVEYIGHVVEDNGSHSRTGHGPGHWFRAMTGQDMAGIDVIGSQVIFGAPVQTRRGMGGMENDGEFFHYILGKLGASAGHLDPRKKGRTMCELFGAYGWNFGVRDMRRLLDHLLSRGVNHLVPHAFSMAAYPDPDCPPHFYAQGHNGEFPWFQELMQYAGRMCGQLSGGRHVARIAVLYDGELDWAGEHLPMQKIGRVLQQNQLEFDVVSCDMLRHPEAYGGSFDGHTLVINGVAFHALLIPQSQYLPAVVPDLARKIRKLSKMHSGMEKGESRDVPNMALPQTEKPSKERMDTPWFSMIAVNGYPEMILEDGTPMPSDETWKDACICAELSSLPQKLKSMGFVDISISPAFDMLSVYHYQKEGQMFFLMNEHPDQAFAGTVTMPADQRMYCYDGDTDRYFALETISGNLPIADGNAPSEADAAELQEGVCCGEDANVKVSKVNLTLEPGQSILLMEETQVPEAWRRMPVAKSLEKPEECEGYLDLSKQWDVELCEAAEYPKSGKQLWLQTLVPMSDLEPAFSGIFRYRKSFRLEQLPVRAFFRAESVFEVMRVQVNGQMAGSRMTPPYQLEVSGLLREGDNEILVEVANTPGRDQQNYPKPPFDFQYEALEPAGMFGKVGLFIQVMK